MKFKICVGQPYIQPGNLSHNFTAISTFIEEAQNKNAQYLILPMDALTGSNLGWLAFQPDFRRDTATLRMQLKKQAGHKLKLVFEDNYDFCGAAIQPKAIGISYQGKNIKVHSGGSKVLNPEGAVIFEGQHFAPQIYDFTFDTEKIDFIEQPPSGEQPSKTELLYRTLCCGASEFFEQHHLEKITIGLSGGIDSAVSAALFANILGPENVMLINMPGEYNSDLTKTLAKNIAHNLGTRYGSVSITQSFYNTLKDMEYLGLSVSPLGMENIQARDRSSRIIAAAAAAFGGVFCSNGNKAELSVGYATFYGDLSGAVAPLGDLWKYQVYELGRYLNQQVYKRSVIPEAVFQIRPSAELSPEQTVGKGGDPLYYPYHDHLLEAFTKGIGLTQIAQWYKEGKLEEKIGCHQNMIHTIFKNEAQNFFDDLEHWWKAYHGLAVAKRLQAPPIILVSDHSFPQNEPQIPIYFSQEYESIKKSLLA